MKPEGNLFSKAQNFLKQKNTLRYGSILLAFIVLIVWGQNCTQTKFDNPASDNYQSLGYDVSEDDLFYKIQNGTATITELEYSQQRYKDYLEEKVSNINSSNTKSNPVDTNREITIKEVIATLTQDITLAVVDLKAMIFDKKLATNSREVLKRYSELIDLLSRARDVNNYLILKSDVGSLRLDVEGLRKDFKALQASLTEVREVIIPKMKEELNKNIDTAKSDLTKDLDARETALRASLTETEKALLAEIKAKEAQLRSELQATEKSILDKLTAAVAATDLKIVQGLSDAETKRIANYNELKNLLNAKYDAAMSAMSKQDQDLRALLTEKFNAAASSLSATEVRVLAKLNSDYTQVTNSLTAAELDLRTDLNTKYNTLVGTQTADKQELITKILAGDNAVRSEFDVKLAKQKEELILKMDNADKKLQDQITVLDALSKSNLTQIEKINDVIININQAIRDTAEALKALSGKVSYEIGNINAQFELIRTQGNENYTQMVQSWNCADDLIDKNGYEFYGASAFKNLGVTVSQACVTSKEQVLYSICKERYPTFCGANQTFEQWGQAMSGKDRLEILLNIRQEVAINYLTEQSRIHGEAIYGGASCNSKCLTAISDPNVQAVLGSITTPVDASGGVAPVCGADEWKKCGLYGVAYSLAVNDSNLTKKILDVNTNLSVELAKLRVDFEKEKTEVASKFGLVVSELNQKIDILKQTTEQRFMDVARSLSGLGSASGPEIAADLANRSSFLAAKAAESANKKALLIQAIADAMGKSVDVAKAQLAGREDEVIKLLSSGMAVSSFEILTQIFSTLNPNQNNRPFYDVDLQNKLAGVCSDFVKYTPFTNIVGRDSHEILAIYYLKAILLGDRSPTANNNRIFFNSTGLLKAASLPQAFVGSSYVYPLNPGLDNLKLPACISALDAWAKDMLLNNAQFDAYRTQLSENVSLQRMVTILSGDGQKVMNLLGSIEALIVATPGADAASMPSKIMTIATRVLQAAIAERVYNLTSQEVESLIAIQKELSVQNGFQSQFNDYLNKYRMDMAAFKTGQADLNTKFVKDIADMKNADNLQAAELQKMKDAMGYVYALAQTDPLASQATKDKVKAAATVDQAILDLIKKINENPPGQPEVPFNPTIGAIRHVTSGTLACFGAAPVAGQLPGGDAFIGHWGLGGNNAPWFPGENCAINFRTGSGFKDKVVYRIWGSAHKISYKSTINNAATVVDFRAGLTDAYPMKQIRSGGVAQGVFDAQVPGLLDPVVARQWAYNDGIVAMTPIYVSGAGVETKGTEKVYTMTLYSPIVLDFVNVGVPKLVEQSRSNVMFDIAARGIKDSVGWVSGKQAGLLALDLNRNGKIDSGAELFGQFTRIGSENKVAENGYEALAQYDENNDGLIDSKDSVFKSLQVWFDNNENGLVEEGELRILSDLAVTAMSLNYKEVPSERQYNEGNRMLYSGKFFGPSQCGVDGCNSFDVYFGTAWTEK